MKRLSTAFTGPSVNVSPGGTGPSDAPPLQRQQSADIFCRYVNSHTVGVERIAEEKENTNARGRKVVVFSTLHDSEELLANISTSQRKSFQKRKSTEDLEYELKLQKFLDVVQEFSKGHEQVSRGDYGTCQKSVNSSGSPQNCSSPAGKTFLTEHKRQQSLKRSKSKHSHGTVLLRKASTQLEDDGSVKKPSLLDIDIVDGKSLQIKKKRGIKAWGMSANDVIESKMKVDRGTRVLEEWQVCIRCLKTTL